ncbi:MAG TPA: CDP-alcohol phosphatidyltransferase family protein [Candidatus Dormibacteraeota bacterium]|nr:CDP-alcohol phosphatidyltransferase family protein [Candidatus Dormibacteraeota bacterium]
MAEAARVSQLRDLLSVPNQLTFLRLTFLPFLIISIEYRRYDWALGVLVAAAVSDALDGILARRLRQKTAIGAYLDPIADKLLLSSSFFMLAVEHKIRWWLAIIVLGRDVLMLTSAAVILLAVGYSAFPPSIWGKLTTAFQILMVFVVVVLALVQNPLLRLARHACIGVVAALTVFSGLHYSLTVARRLSQ